jgi:hypothetical protein
MSGMITVPGLPFTMSFGRPVDLTARVRIRFGPDDELGVGELDDRVALAIGEVRAQWLRDRSQLPRGDRGLDERHRVGQRDRHEVALADSELVPRTGDLVGAPVELGARDRPHRAVGFPAGDGGPVRIRLRKHRDRATQRKPIHGRDATEQKGATQPSRDSHCECLVDCGAGGASRRGQWPHCRRER